MNPAMNDATIIREDDIVETVADALQYISLSLIHI